MMDMLQVMKEFISNAHLLIKQNNIDVLVKNLQILSAADDLSVFAPGSFVTAEFYSLLRDLLNNQDTDADLVWAIVNVLQVAVGNTNTSSVLVQTYHFLCPLTTILEAQFTSEKRLVLLNLIQELTYGLVIRWQEPHLPRLTAVLMDIIRGGHGALVPPALNVLVNLCHRNKPAVYVVLNTVDVKEFLRTILKLERENLETSVQVCKLLMIFDQLSSQVPDKEILSFVQVSFIRINKAFNCGNTFLIRHIVDFFHDAKESEHGKKVLLKYPKYPDELNKLITLLHENEDPNSWPCVQQMVRFLQELVDLELPSLSPLFTQLTQCLLPWLKVDGVAATVLDFISSLMYQSRNQNYEVYNELCVCIKNHLQMLCEMLNDKCHSCSSSRKTSDSLTSLIHFLRELAANSSLTSQLSSLIDKENLKNLFLPLVSPSVTNTDAMFQQSASALYIEALSFISALSLEDNEWLFLYIDLLQKKSIIKALAHALYSGSADVKRQILCLAGTPSFSKECLTMLSRCLVDLNQLFRVDNVSPSYQCADKGPSYLQSSPPDFSFSLTKAQNEDLDSLIERLQDTLKNGQIADVSLAGIIELYNYKLCEMRRAERSLQASMAAGDRHRVDLSQRVAHLTAETGRLHQLLHSGHQTLESYQQDVSQLRSQLAETQRSANHSHQTLKQIQSEARSKNAELNEEILKLRQAVAELTARSDELQDNVVNLERHKSDLEATHSKLKEKLDSSEQLMAEKDVLISNKNAQVKTLEQEVINNNCRLKELERSLNEKEKKITAQTNELMELQRMRKVIFDLAGGKKNNG